MLPAAAVHDGFTTPDTGGAVEVEEVAGTVPATVLEHEVAVEKDGLDLRQERVVPVDVTPARLDHGDGRIDEERHRASQEVGRRNEVRIEDRDEVAFGDLHAGFERARLVARSIGPVKIADVDPLRRVPPHRLFGDAARFVGGVVEHLNLEELARILQPADGIDQPIRHVHLVVDRELNRDWRERLERPGGSRLLSLVLHVQVHQVVPVPTVDGKNDKNEEVRPENQRFRSGHA